MAEGNSRKRIEVAILAGQTARSVLDLTVAQSRMTSAVMWTQIMDDMEHLRKAITEAWPE